jgi:GH25 family lysozyme M1 (1,4-beta-N-acetylmuramidase)
MSVLGSKQGLSRAVVLLALALLSACTSMDDLSPTSGGASTTVALSNPRFKDNDPHTWESGAPWTYAVHGTDVSKYQRSVDWAQAKASGISFAFIKATEGGDRVDDLFSNTGATLARRRAARRLSFLLFLPAGGRTGGVVHRQRAA